MKEEKTLIHQPVPLAEMQTMADSIAKSQMFGVKTVDQALSLMLLCQAEGIHPVMALRRYHIIEGKPSMRADALQGQFEQTGAILWHERTDIECSATFFADKRKAEGPAIKRAKERYAALKAGNETASLAEMGELTIIRTLQDAVNKKLAMSWDREKGEWKMKHNWQQSPRQMLHARTLTEGVRAISPGLIAGIYTEDEISDMPEVIQAELVPDRNVAAEERVTAATENRLDVNNGKDLLFEDGTVRTRVTVEITEENYGEVESHIGQAGKLLGQKVGEMKLPVLKWLSTHYGEGEGKRWGVNPNEKDKRLKQAVEIALSKHSGAKGEVVETGETKRDLPSVEQGPEKTAAPVSPPIPGPGIVASAIADGKIMPIVENLWRDVTVPFECKIKGEKLGDLQQGVYRAIKTQIIDKWDWKKATQEEKDFLAPFEAGAKEMGWLMTDDELRAAIKDRTGDLILTPRQLDGYLQDPANGILAKDESIETVEGKLLLYIYQNWPMIKAIVEEDVKTKVEKKKPGKKK